MMTELSRNYGCSLPGNRRVIGLSSRNNSCWFLKVVRNLSPMMLHPLLHRNVTAPEFVSHGKSQYVSIQVDFKSIKGSDFLETKKATESSGSSFCSRSMEKFIWINNSIPGNLQVSIIITAFLQ